MNLYTKDFRKRFVALNIGFFCNFKALNIDTNLKLQPFLINAITQIKKVALIRVSRQIMSTVPRCSFHSVHASLSQRVHGEKLMVQEA